MKEQSENITNTQKQQRENLFISQAAELLLSLAGLKVIPKVKFDDPYKNFKLKDQ